MAWAGQNATVTLSNFVTILAGVALLCGVTKIFYLFRARAMNALASRWGLRYAGPAGPKWWKRSHRPEIGPSLPGWFSGGLSPLGQTNRSDLERDRGKSKWSAASHFRQHSRRRERQCVLYCYRVPDGTESIRNGSAARSPNPDARMDNPSRSLVSLVFVDDGHTSH